ncbi:MAG: type II toxin-antitoxin system HigB family toxin [Oleispira sp.]|nr:type II toxin-antitoxin system HigB family toxin [Oleispira sp.]MBL4879993.1 type II toxin-antitoxin system HigB family toxin [Oleispira sp.]
MKVLSRDKLTKFSKKHANSKGALDAWFDEVSKEESAWKTTHDIKNRYPSADFLADNRVIFNIKGNHYRLVVEVRYQNGFVVVEWVGTHAEYDKKSF